MGDRRFEKTEKLMVISLTQMPSCPLMLVSLTLCWLYCIFLVFIAPPRSLGKVMNTPEVCRVYMGSFWDAPLQYTDQSELLQQEEIDLLNDIMGLPQQAVMRRINELVKRARSVKVHAYLVHYLRKQLPYTWGKRDKQKRLIGRLESEMMAAARRYGLPKGDFPAIEPFRQALLEIRDLSEFPKLDKKQVREMDKVFSVDIPDLLEKARNH